MNLTSVKLAAAAALLGAALSGCVIGPAPAYEGEVVYQAPPPPQYEAYGVAPAPGYLWIGGAWFWEGGRYAWHPGRWEAPRPGYRWVPHRWARVGKGYRMAPGHWEEHRR
jgi:hypothetical protein